MAALSFTSIGSIKYLIRGRCNTAGSPFGQPCTFFSLKIPYPYASLSFSHATSVFVLKPFEGRVLGQYHFTPNGSRQALERRLNWYK